MPYNWDELKAEWLRRSVSENISLNQFRLEKNIPGLAQFYDRIRRDKWVEDKKRLVKKTYSKIESKVSTQIANSIAERYRLQDQIYDAGEKHIAKGLMQNVVDGKITTPLAPDYVASAMLAANRALNGKRLMDGLSTQNIDERSLTMGILKIVDDIEEKQIDH